MDTMKYWTCLTTLMLFFGMQNQMEAYQECEELEKCTLMHNVYGNLNANTFYTWRINITQVGACNTDGCSTYRNFEDHVTVKIKKDKNYVSFIVEFSNVTRELVEHFGNNWNLVDTSFNVIFETTLLFIVKPKQLNCTYNASTEGLFIACVGSRSFPQSLCNVSLNYNGNKSSELLPRKYHHSKVSNEPVYYITTCSTMIKASNVTTGLYEIHVVIYPDAKTKTCDDCGSITVKVNIDKPAIELVNCSKLVIEGTRVDCTCRRTDMSDIATRVEWDQGHASVQQDKNMSVLTSKVSSQAQKFTCVAVNDLGWSINQTYTPDIFYHNTSGCSDKRPHVCLPSPTCYGNDQFCNEGKVESCFPLDIVESELLTWCERTGQFNVSLMGSRACNQACAARFGSEYIKRASETSSKHFESHVFITLGVVLFIFIIVSLIIVWRFCPETLTHVRNRLFQFESYRNCLNVDKQKNSTLKEWNTCENNSRHEGLILCSQYKNDPKHYINKFAGLDNDLREKIKKYIDLHIVLTVRILVEQKPQAYKSDTERYSFIGSGLVVNVKPTDLPCNCSASDNLENHNRWCVYISTSAKVVGNEMDAKSTIAELFYDDVRKTGVKQLYGSGIYQINKESSIIKCVTCEKDVYNQLKTTLNECVEMLPKLNCNSSYVIVVSHPHGMPKHISFGTVIETDATGCLKHNAATCDGSQGAAILTLNETCKEWFSRLITADFVVHTGVDQQRKNFSGLAPVDDDVDASKMLLQSCYIPIEPDPENNDTGSEQGLFTVNFESKIDMDGDLSATCQKDRYHKGFIPINIFSLDRLAPMYQKKNIFDYIKNLANLTLKIDVHFTSSNRPDFIDQTKSPYPGSNLKGKSCLRSGSGVVVSVIEVTDGITYPCPHCKQSDWPCKVYYLVYVCTAKHIVFDDSEAAQSKVSFGHDNDSPSVLTFSGGKMVKSEMKLGTSIIEYVTHDTRIAHISESLRNLYKLERKMEVEIEDKNNHSLAVIISHLHGWSKHISTGDWLERELTISKSGTYVRYTYTTATCPGSSGAPVFIPGEGVQRVFKHLCLPHVHRETEEDGRGVSCSGIKSFRVVKSKSE